MTAPQITVNVDRDSVAMGDDAISHARVTHFAPGTPVSRMVEASAPEIHSRGWSWVAVVGGEVSAVWSADHGVRLLVPDRALSPERPVETVHFRYFLQIDPEWLFQRLAEGAPAHRDTLAAEYAPIAVRKREQELHRREREQRERLLSAQCVGALQTLGAAIELHADSECHFDLHAEHWVVRRADTMTQVFRGSGAPVASIRPIAFAESWIVAAVAAEARAARGLAALPAHEALPAPELRPMVGSRLGPQRWTSTGAITAQLTGDDAVASYRLAAGRTVDEIVALMLLRDDVG